jgi:Coenzyme PQQ synthesis protein D (PqqD)
LKLHDDRVAWREVEGEIVALDLDDSTYLAINNTGRLIWYELAAGASREDLVEKLVQAYDIPLDQAAADVDAFLAELRKRDFLAEHSD